MTAGRDEFVRVAGFGSHDEARAAGARLLESGVVALVDEDATGAVGLTVLPGDVARACELLGLEVPEGLREEAPAEPTEAPKRRLPIPRDRMMLFVLLYAGVVVGVTVVVFFLVVWFLGAGTEEVDPPTFGP